MQASLLLPTLIHILTLCRPPYHEAPETPPRRARAGHPVATEKRVKTRRTGIPPTTRRNDAAPKLRTARRPQLRIAPASARKRTYPPRNIHSTHRAARRSSDTTASVPHDNGRPTPQAPHRAALPCPTPRRTAQTHRSEARRHPTPRRKRPRILMDPGAFVMCGGRDYLRYTFS